MNNFTCKLKFRIYLDNIENNTTYNISSINNTKLKIYNKEINTLITKLNNKNIKKKIENIINSSVSYDTDDLFQYFNFKINKMNHIKDLEFNLDISIYKENKLPKLEVKKEIKKSDLPYIKNPEILLNISSVSKHINDCLDNHYEASDSLVYIKNKNVIISETFNKGDIKKLKIL